jgi:hypothetical protein
MIVAIGCQFGLHSLLNDLFWVLLCVRRVPLLRIPMCSQQPKQATKPTELSPGSQCISQKQLLNGMRCQAVR